MHFLSCTDLPFMFKRRPQETPKGSLMHLINRSERHRTIPHPTVPILRTPLLALIPSCVLSVLQFPRSRQVFALSLAAL